MKRKIIVLVLMIVSMFIFCPDESQASISEDTSGSIHNQYKQVNLPGGQFRFRYRYRVEGNRSSKRRAAARRTQLKNRRARYIRKRIR